MATDQDFMFRAIALSRKGYPAPNPHVGCVITLGDKIVGEGYHRRAGEGHAEVVALRQAGEQARGGTAFVTLEPCNHQGRTGPCSLALIEAGVKRVVYAVRDPNPRAAGGHEVLAAAGVTVESGVLADEAEAANAVFLTAVRREYPYVCVKAAMSLDGRIALPSGESKWITGPEARREAHKLRAETGAVLVGPGTILADDPQLTARFRGAPQVTRIVLDPRGEVPESAKVFEGAAPTVHVVPYGMSGKGIRLEQPLVDGRFAAVALLQALYGLGILGILVEGGAKTIGAFLPYADRIELFVSGKVLGSGSAWVEGFSVMNLDQAPRFVIRKVTKCGDDLRVTAVPMSHN